MRPLRVLIGGEFSGRIRDAFLALGHDAWSCDFLDTEVPGPHLRGDWDQYLDMGWDLGIFHPTCTRMCLSGLRWLYGGKGTVREPVRWAQMEADAHAFRRLLDDKRIPRIVLENSQMHPYALAIVGRKADQVIQPWQFGYREMKATHLWLRGVAPLVPTDVVGPPPKDPVERRKWARVHQASPGPDRWKVRSRTCPGIAEAFAAQLGGVIVQRGVA